MWGNELYEIFREYGDIKVVIPFKRYKRGKRCDFPRFINILDKKHFATKMDSMFIVIKKLFPTYQDFKEVQLEWKQLMRS